MPHGKDKPLTAAPRPLTEREREILDFLLSVEVPGIEELRLQSKRARAVPWDCGCASINLYVDRSSSSPSSLRERPAIEAESKDRGDDVLDLLLWTDGGWLSGIEIVDYDEVHGERSAIFPHTDHFEAPFVRERG